MDAQRVDMFLMINSRFFEGHHIGQIRERLLLADESRWFQLQTVQFMDPSIALIVSVIVGHFGIDRFMVGDTGLGVAKLLTCGGLGIWTIIDWFMIMSVAKEKNILKLQQILY